jgi:PhnB protein
MSTKTVSKTKPKTTPQKTKETSAKTQAESLPKLHTVTPHLVCAGAAKAIEFYKKAFGAKELMRLAGPDGHLWHARVQIGDSSVMLVDEFPAMGSFGPKHLKGSPVTIHLNVSDAGAVAEQAVAAGAKVVMPVGDAFWGDRYGIVEDPFGHRWSIAHSVRVLTPEEIKAAMPKEADCGGAANEK